MGNSSTVEAPSELTDNRKKAWHDAECSTMRCFECNKVLHRDAKPGEDGYWEAGHDWPASLFPEGSPGKDDESNLNPTCRNCNNGMYRDISARDRVMLKIEENRKFKIADPKRFPRAYSSTYPEDLETGDYRQFVRDLLVKARRKKKSNNWKFY